jgi:hypothetical protein
MKTKFNPYSTENFTELMRWANWRCNYSGKLSLVKITIDGDFELHGRASESWQTGFVVETCKVNKYEAHSAYGETLDEACGKILALLKREGWG